VVLVVALTDKKLQLFPCHLMEEILKLKISIKKRLL
jgi:hypothetical protein